jgi:hypothetical protein
MGTTQPASNPVRDRLVRAWGKKLAQRVRSMPPLARTPASDKPQASSSKLAEIEAEVDVESARLWNLSASDLAEIQRSLDELVE